ncbi:putative S-layer associated protein [Lachnospiraceae bacterium KM106-2]|nr:putative S-layer associated protein [Lachnospiraceae bacterium KM106-2]
MKRLKKLQLSLMALLFTLVVAVSYNPMISQASSATVTLSVLKSDIKVGQKFSVSIVLNASEAISSFETQLKYDPSVLKFVSGGSYITEADGVISLLNDTVEDGTTKQKYVMQFEALEAGSSKIQLSGKPLIYDLENGKLMSLSSNSVTVNVGSTESQSKNNYLKSLKIGEGTLSPAFDKNVLNYNVTVDASCERIIYTAIPEDTKARVNVKGATNLKTGTNPVTITVTSEAGTKKVYTIVVKKEEGDAATPEPSVSPEPSPSETPKEEVKLEDETKLEEIDKEQVVCIQKYYTVAKLSDESMIPEGYEKSSLNLNGTSIPAYTLKSNLNSEFVLLYLENQNGEKGFYQYDRQEKTVQRYQEQKVSVQPSADELKTEASKSSNTNTLVFAIVSLCLIIVILVIISLRLFMRRKQR